MKNPLNVSLNDIIKEHERLKDFMVVNYAGRVKAGSLGAATSRRRIECMSLTIRLLKKYRKDPELDFNAALEEGKKKAPSAEQVAATEDPYGDDFYLEGGGYE